MTPTDLAAACLAGLAQVEKWERRTTETTEAVLAAKAQVEHIWATLITAGLAGKNAQEREAHLLLNTQGWRDRLAEAEKDHRAAQTELRIAQERLKTHRALLRALGPGSAG